MTEAAAIEAVRAAGGANWAQQAAVPQSPDPNAVAAFADAMAAPAPDAIPFVRQIAETWRGAEIRNQQCLHESVNMLGVSEHRILSLGEFSRLQYELSEASFQMEITTLVAKKVSDAVSTLLKNGYRVRVKGLKD